MRARIYSVRISTHSIRLNVQYPGRRPAGVRPRSTAVRRPLVSHGIIYETSIAVSDRPRAGPLHPWWHRRSFAKLFTVHRADAQLQWSQVLNRNKPNPGRVFVDLGFWNRGNERFPTDGGIEGRGEKHRNRANSFPGRIAMLVYAQWRTEDTQRGASDGRR